MPMILDRKQADARREAREMLRLRQIAEAFYEGNPVVDISGFSAAINDQVADLLVAGSNVSLNYNSGAGTLTVDAAGGGAAPAASFFGAPLVIKPDAGAYIGNLPVSVLTTQASGANRVDLAPFLAPWDMTIDEVRYFVSTAVTGSAAVLIFNADADGRPTTLLAQSATGDTNSATVKNVAISASLEAGKVYWIGVWTSAACTLRVSQTYASFVLSWNSAATPTGNNVLRRTEAFGGTASDWTYDNSQLTAARAPIVLMRIA